MLTAWLRALVVTTAVGVTAWPAMSAAMSSADDQELTAAVDDEADSSQAAPGLREPSAPPPPLIDAIQPVRPLPDGAKPDLPRPSSRAAIRTVLEREALKVGLPADIAEAVVQVESSFNPSVIGTVGEIGLMQVRPSTAAMLGFRGTPDELAQPDTNIHYGVVYLAKAWRIANGDLCRALMKYRAGHGEETMTALSVRYCERARSYLAALGSPYAGPDPPLPKVLQPTPAAVGPIAAAASPAALPAPKTVYARFRQGTAAASKAYWQAQEARVRMITARLRAKWHRVALR